MIKIALIFVLSGFSLCALGQQRLVPDGMGGWIIQNGPNFSEFGPAQSGVRLGEIDRQNALIWQQQIQNMQLQNELLTRQLQKNQSTNQPRPQQAPPVSNSMTPEFRNWQAENPWFGSDGAKTEFALQYAQQLRRDQPNLTGPAFFDVLDMRLRQAFGAGR